MKNSTISGNCQKLLSFLDDKMNDGNFTNEDLVQFIESVGKYLGLQTLPNYSKENNMSYNGVWVYSVFIKIGIKF